MTKVFLTAKTRFEVALEIRPSLSQLVPSAFKHYNDKLVPKTAQFRNTIFVIWLCIEGRLGMERCKVAPEIQQVQTSTG